MSGTEDHSDIATKELADQGFRCLEVRDYAGALEIAKLLEQRRFTAAFEIGALAYAGLGQIPQAIELLERGVEVAPSVWLLWQLLGNYRSDSDQFEGAAEAYEKALACAEVSKPSVYLNQAILAGRQGQPQLALELLDQTAASTSDDKLLAQVEASRGWMMLKSGASADEVLQQAKNALERFPDGRPLFHLIRGVHDLSSEKAKYFRILVHAKIPAEHELAEQGAGFFTTYDVVDESVEQAMRWVEQLENSDGVGLKLTSESAEQLAKRPGDPFGVYLRTARSFYLAE